MKRGFTVLELLLVMAIIGLLAGSVIVSTTNARKKSRDQKRHADLLAIQSALEVYFAQNKRYPSSCAAASSSGVDSGGTSPWLEDRPCSGSAAVWFIPRYIQALPIDPTNSSPYVYRYRTSGGTSAVQYELDAKLETDNTSMQNDGGGCTDRLELFNINFNLLGCL